MRRRSRAAAGLLVGLAWLLATSRARAAEVVLEVGLRAGYIFGLGWTVGPSLSLAGEGQPFEFMWNKAVGIVGGLAVSGDAVIGAGNEVSFRLHVGPELGLVKACPALAANVTLGPAWMFRRGASPRLAFEGGASFLGGLADLSKSGSAPLFAGIAFRYTELVGGEGTQELGLDLRAWSLPSNQMLFPFRELCVAIGGGEPIRTL